VSDLFHLSLVMRVDVYRHAPTDLPPVMKLCTLCTGVCLISRPNLKGVEKIKYQLAVLSHCRLGHPFPIVAIKHKAKCDLWAMCID